VDPHSTVGHQGPRTDCFPAQRTRMQRSQLISFCYSTAKKVDSIHLANCSVCFTCKATNWPKHTFPQTARQLEPQMHVPPWYPVISRTGAILIKIRMCVSADILRLHNLQLSQVGVMATSQEMNKDAIPRICLRWKYQRLTSRLSPCYHTWYLQMSGITNLFQSTESSCSPPYLPHYYPNRNNKEI